MTGGRSSSSLTPRQTDPAFASFRRITSSTVAAGSTIPTMPNAANSSSSFGSTAASRVGSRDISTSGRTTRIPSPSPPSIPRRDPTPTAVPASLFRPPSCVPVPPATDGSNLVSSAATRMASKSAPSITRTAERSVWMPPSPTAMTLTRLVSTLTVTLPTRTRSSSRFISPPPVTSSTPPMMATLATSGPRTVLSSSLMRLLRIPRLGGTWPADVSLVC
mmetsp:Transcript_13198/g.28656  ORF Transcript_13198/g.28656 Transcript_13198/m.28656 type:complete len:219 (+) Transcript_13198:743-1399(+)